MNNATASENKVEFTNIRSVGKLVVSKTVTGNAGEEEREFDFTLTLDRVLNQYGANVNDAYKTTLTTTTDEGTTTEPGSLTVLNGTANFKLTHGQTITIEGLPEGTGYNRGRNGAHRRRLRQERHRQ